ncbi:transcription termination factor MTERF4, chloroplastic [Amborella trichopoda]|uniref:Uncharacterized protein n=1 Tax=Amborella trichopoda TaxID=13333 RepID=W1NKU2_AMBTC|nr:transcription termination factor MTERF4, chloroplastic [Amborella trichopoda]ERM95820.1 hypothetical protein AMTR_s00060p00059830 [Amborella trichopoda]|eukprot:XP_006828404.1 transcription termination factor MTERF4, chloroplastic [Amborella trichopoda]
MGLTKSFSLYKTHNLISLLIPLPLASSLQQISTKTPPLPLSNPSSLASDSAALNTSSTINYLIESLGLSKEAAIATFSIYPTLKTSGNPISVIKFLRNSGFLDTHIDEIVSREPQILASDVQKTLKPKLRLFQELDLSGTELKDFITANPSLFRYSVNKRLYPSVLFLRNYLTNEEILMAIKRCGWILFFDPDKILLPNINTVQKFGIVGSELAKFLSKYPRIFTQDPKRTEEIAERVKELGFTSHSNMFCYAMIALSSISKETLQSKVTFFKSCGWSEDDISAAFRRMPYLLSLSTKKLRKGMEYFTNEMKFDQSFLVAHPQLFSYSLEGRVIPRHKVVEALRLKNLLKKDVYFLGVCGKLEKEFLEKYVYYYEDEAVYLLRIYKESKENTLNGA